MFSARELWARRCRAEIRFISTSGRATLSQPDFDEPWEAEALALAMALIDTGRITKAEWAEALGAAIR
jgi:hypothetical protein